MKTGLPFAKTGLPFTNTDLPQVKTELPTINADSPVVFGFVLNGRRGKERVMIGTEECIQRRLADLRKGYSLLSVTILEQENLTE